MAMRSPLLDMMGNTRAPWTRREAQRELQEAVPLPIDDEEEPDTGVDKPGYKAARLLLEFCKKRNATFQASFNRDWQFLLGENHFRIPKNALALKSSEVKSQTVRNWMFATCDQKAGMILASKPKITAAPYAGPVTFTDRWRAQEVLAAEGERLRIDEYHEDAFWDGMAVGKGLTRVIRRIDERSGMKYLELEDVDPGCWFPDPTASRLHQAKHAHLEVWMDAAEIRKAFPNTWKLVKMEERKFSSTDARSTTSTGANTNIGLGRSRTEAEIVQSPGKDITVGTNGDLSERGAFVSFSWIVDEEVVEEVEERQRLGMAEGYQCAGCGAMFEHETPVRDLNDYMTPETAEPPPPVSCPECGTEAVMPVTLPAGVEFGDQITRFRYPFGRLTVTTDSALLYDGANPDEIDCFFPVAEYTHYRVNRRYWGYGEVAHLKAAQIAADKTVTQLLDYIRTAVNGVLEYPEAAMQYKDLGNAPNPRIGLPPPLIGLARYLPPPPLSIQAFEYIDRLIERDFQRMSGVTDYTSGLGPTAPTSGDEVEARVQAGTVRMTGHRKRFDQYRGDLWNIIFQMMWQNYREPRYYPVSDSLGRVQMIQIEMQKLPRNMRMTVTSEPEQLKKSELTIQAMQELMLSNQIPPMLDLLLPLTGMSQDDADILMSRIELMREEQAAMAQANPMAAAAMASQTPQGTQMPGVDPNTGAPPAAPPMPMDEPVPGGA